MWAVGTKLARRNYNRIAGIKYFLRFALFVLARHEANIKRVSALLQVALAELEPGDFRPLREGIKSVVRSSGRRLVPLAAIDAPLERRAHELEADAVPDLVLARVFQVELVRQQAAACGQVFGDFIRRQC
jgi:hypothetical protein